MSWTLCLEIKMALYNIHGSHAQFYKKKKCMFIKKKRKKEMHFKFINIIVPIYIELFGCGMDFYIFSEWLPRTIIFESQELDE